MPKHHFLQSRKLQKLQPAKRKYRSKAKKAQNRILIMLAFFSISVGLWENFRQLWLQDNNFTATEIGNITSIGTLVGVLGIILVGRYLKMRHLKTFMSAILFAKILFLFALVFLDRSGLTELISFCTIFDVVTTNLIVISVYPLLTTVIKNNRVYSRRKLVEYLFRDLGILVGGLLIGRRLLGVVIGYNGCLVASMVFMAVAATLMFSFEFRITQREPSRRGSIVKYIMKSRIQRIYMVYAYLAATSFATVTGLKMLMLTDQLDFSVDMATGYLLVVGLLSDVIGIFALKYFTPKNDYLTMTLKFGIRFGIYLIAICSNNFFFMLIALTWSILSSTAYEDVSDGYYINTIDNRHQFRYSTVKYVVTYLGEATGLFLAGWMYNYGLAEIIGLSAAITIVQLGIAYYLIFIRHHPRKRLLKRSTSRRKTNAVL